MKNENDLAFDMDAIIAAETAEAEFSEENFGFDSVAFGFDSVAVF